MAKEDKKAEGPTNQTVDITALVRAEVTKAASDIVAQLTKKLNEDKTGLAQLAPAYIAARKRVRMAVKNATNPHLRNTYADLGSVLEAVTEAFLENDLWLVQAPGEITIKDGLPYMTLTGVLLHGSGQNLSFKSELPAFTLSKDGKTVINPQTAGSATAYARRYMWNAVAGLTQVDDDADAASYLDTAEGPQGQGQGQGQSAQSTPKADEAQAMIDRIKAAPDMEKLKELRAAADGMKNASVREAYMARRESLLPKE